MNVKKPITALALLAVNVLAYAAIDLRRSASEADSGEQLEQSYWLVVSLRDGTTEGQPFNGRPTITIKDGLFNAATTDRTVSYPAKSVERFRLTDNYDTPKTNGDVNGDGAVNVADISAVISVMAGSDAEDAVSVRADVNGDEAVNVADIAEIITIMASDK